jgi:hypothetical protein
MQLISVNSAEPLQLTAGASPTKIHKLTDIPKPELPSEAATNPYNERELLQKLQ